MSDVVILTMSEFGRAVAENGNRGTDHGHGNAMMIIGGQNVRGGKVYGRWPGLAREQRYDGRDLAVTTDFRSVFAEVVRGHLGVTDTRTIFPGFTDAQRLGFIAVILRRGRRRCRQIVWALVMLVIVACSCGTQASRQPQRAGRAPTARSTISSTRTSATPSN